MHRPSPSNHKSEKALTLAAVLATVPIIADCTAVTDAKKNIGGHHCYLHRNAKLDVC